MEDLACEAFKERRKEGQLRTENTTEGNRSPPIICALRYNDITNTGAHTSDAIREAKGPYQGPIGNPLGVCVHVHGPSQQLAPCLLRLLPSYRLAL